MNRCTQLDEMLHEDVPRQPLEFQGQRSKSHGFFVLLWWIFMQGRLAVDI